MANQVQPPPGQLPFRPDLRARQPDGRHEVLAGELGQDPGIDAIGLQANGARPLTFWASAISTVQPASSKKSCTKRAPVIASMTATDRLGMASQVAHQMLESVGVGRPAALLHDCASLVHDADVEPRPAQVHSDVQHCAGAYFVNGSGENPRSHRGKPRFMAFIRDLGLMDRHDRNGGPISQMRLGQLLLTLLEEMEVIDKGAEPGTQAAHTAIAGDRGPVSSASSRARERQAGHLRRCSATRRRASADIWRQAARQS